MQQPEIKFVNKLIRMRLVAERLGVNKKPNVMSYVIYLQKHIQANGYAKPNESKLFFLRHCEKIEYIIPSGKTKLIEEFNQLNRIG